MRWYYPSCNFQRLFPDTAKRIQAFLQTREDVRIAGCCHKTQQLPQEGDEILGVCMSCLLGLAEMRPDVPCRSLFEYLLELPDFPWPDLSGEALTLQDCFRARGNHALQDAVRACLARCGATVVEMPHNRDEEDFDGSFRFHAPYEQSLRDAPHYFGEVLPPFVTPIPEEDWPARFREHAALFATRRVVCYCNTCTTAARQGGADAVHLAELLFPEP